MRISLNLLRDFRGTDRESADCIAVPGTRNLNQRGVAMPANPEEGLLAEMSGACGASALGTTISLNLPRTFDRAHRDFASCNSGATKSTLGVVFARRRRVTMHGGWEDVAAPAVC